jgi:hypothetical protein
MPDSSTGGTEGRATTARPSGADEMVRVDMEGNGVTTFTDSAGRAFRDVVTDVEFSRSGIGSTTYTFASGRTLWVSMAWRSGDPVPLSDISWRNRRNGGGPIDPVPCECRSCRDRDHRRLSATIQRAIPVTLGAPTRIGLGDLDFTATVRRLHYNVQQTNDRMSLLRETAQAELERATALRSRLDREREARAARMASAGQRAEETLKKILRPDELKTYERTGKLIVTASDGRKYLIGPGIVGNVRLLDKRGRQVAYLCCHPNMTPTANSPGVDLETRYDMLPYRDAHIAQILYLRHDLKKFWQTANIEWERDSDYEAYRAEQREEIRQGRRWIPEWLRR